VRRRNPPPGRKRKLKCSQKKKLNHIQISTSTNPDVIQFRMEKLENLNRSPRAIGLRNSKAWFTKLTAPLTRVELPLIDHLGRYTGCNIYYTGCMRPDSYVNTVISTIFQRLMNYSRKHNGLRETRIRQSILLRVAAYYGLTKNSYFLDRALHLIRFLRKRFKVLSSLTHFFSSKLNANKRFVYSHVCYQTQWFTFRARRPRDKLRMPSSFLRGYPEEWGSDRVRYDLIWDVFTHMSQI
jgi:hypothetical protein